MVPGLMHCSGGPGGNEFGGLMRSARSSESSDMLRALESWVERDVVPSEIIAARYIDGDPNKEVECTPSALTGQKYDFE
jgi:hypothetical protein